MNREPTPVFDATVVLWEALDGFTAGLRVGGGRLSNLRNGDDSATHLEELNTLVSRLVCVVDAGCWKKVWPVENQSYAHQ